jgi:DNA-binding beta-propeller fold protein YncE
MCPIPEAAPVSVVNTATSKPAVKPIGVGHGPIAVAISPDGGRFYVFQHWQHRLHYDAATNKPASKSIKVGPFPLARGQPDASTSSRTRKQSCASDLGLPQLADPHSSIAFPPSPVSPLVETLD